MQNVTIDRDKYIGGSDIPSIMGISPFKTRWQLLQEKAGLLENDFEGNIYTEYGNVMEEKIRNYINETEKVKFEEGKYIDGYIRCHTDGINSDTVLEIKTTSQVHNKVDDYKVYLVQLLFYMYHTKRKKGKLAVYARPTNFDETFNKDLVQVYDIKLSDYKELVNNINNSVEKFIEDLEKIKNNPFLTEEELLPVTVQKYANEIALLEEEMEQYKILEKKYKETKENLKIEMEKFNIKKWETPNGVKITLVEDTEDKIETIKEVNEDLFRTENFELVQAYELKQTEYLEEKEIIKKGRKGYIKITLPS